MKKYLLLTIIVLASLTGLIFAQISGDPLQENNEPLISLTYVGAPYKSYTSYVFNIGTYEVTNYQYSVFLNAVAKNDAHHLFNTTVGPYNGIIRTGISGQYTYTIKPDFANKPVNYVKWLDCIRFVNWLNNGQKKGEQDTTTTEDGSYLLTGNDIYDYLYAERKIEANWVIPNPYEWKKAAYYDDYNHITWIYATQSNNPPVKAAVNSTGDVINFGNYCINYGCQSNWNGVTAGGNVTTVGSCRISSYWGTYDQNGNVGEWTEQIDFISATIGSRIYYGGGYGTVNAVNLTYGIGPVANLNDPDAGGQKMSSSGLGFRVVKLK